MRVTAMMKRSTVTSSNDSKRERATSVSDSRRSRVCTREKNAVSYITAPNTA